MNIEKAKVPPRKVPSRDEKYMGLAFMYAALSKDPRTQHGSQIVTVENEPLGWGYNGPPKQMNDEELNWDRPDKYPYIVHSEPNAIDHSDRGKLDGAIMYVTGKPCAKCMLDIVKSGVKEVVYYEDACHHDSNSMCVKSEHMESTEDIAARGHVKLRVFSGNLSWLRERIQVLEKMGVFGI
jgi:deoxycytidylate deaminase